MCYLEYIGIGYNIISFIVSNLYGTVEKVRVVKSDKTQFCKKIRLSINIGIVTIMQRKGNTFFCFYLKKKQSIRRLG